MQDACKIPGQTAAQVLSRTDLSKQGAKQLKKLPNHIVNKFNEWRKKVHEQGIAEVRKIPGFHDEPLHGAARAGQRSVRLNDGYRLFYKITKEGDEEVISIIEINKHVY